MEYTIEVRPDKAVNLANIDTRENGGLKKSEGNKRLLALRGELSELQESLYATGTHALLLVLQGMDTSGKNGTIVVKCFLHISTGEQEERLRCQSPCRDAPALPRGLARGAGTAGSGGACRYPCDPPAGMRGCCGTVEPTRLETGQGKPSPGDARSVH